MLPEGRFTDSVTDAEGSPVSLRTFEMRDVPASDKQQVHWLFDGTDKTGNALPSGTYNVGFVLTSVDQQGSLRGTDIFSEVFATIMVR